MLDIKIPRGYLRDIFKHVFISELRIKIGIITLNDHVQHYYLSYDYILIAF